MGIVFQEMFALQNIRESLLLGICEIIFTNTIGTQLLTFLVYCILIYPYLWKPMSHDNHHHTATEPIKVCGLMLAKQHHALSHTREGLCGTYMAFTVRLVVLE